MAAYLSVLDDGERATLVDIVTTTRDSIEM